MKNSLSRFRVKTALLGGLFFSMAPGLAAAESIPDFTGITVKVATFGGGWGKVLDTYAGEEFRKTGGKVEFLPSHPNDALAKLIAARGRAAPFDVVEMSDATIEDFTQGGFIQKINLDMVPNTKYLDPQDFDSMKVASWVTQEGVLYRPDKFKEAGVPEPTRYMDLANPKLHGHVSVININGAGVVQFLAGAAADRGGSEADLEMGFDTLKQIDPVRYTSLGADTMSALAAGDLWAATMHSGYFLQSRKAGHDWAFLHPQVGDKKGLLKHGYLGVVKGSKQADAAAYFINTYIGETNQRAIFVERGAVAVNKKILNQYKDDKKIEGIYILDDEGIANMMRIDFDKLDPEYKDKWNRTVAAQ